MNKNIFFPDKTNKRRSHLTHPKGFIIYVVLLLSFFVLIYYSERRPDVLGYATDISVNELLSDTNEYRRNIGLNNLKINEKLNKAALAKAKDMFEDDYWAHIAPDGTKPWDFIKSYEYDYIYAGENLAVDFSTSDDVVDAWYKSVSHRENLLEENYTEVGFAVMNGELQGRKTTLVVQMFGKPKISSAFLAEEGSKTLVDSSGIEATVNNNNLVEQVELSTTNNIPTEFIPMNVEPSANPSEIIIGSVLNSSDVFNVSKYITIILGIFVTFVLALDGYYVRKFGIFRITGHTFLHIAVLFLVLAAIWYTNVGLVL